MDEDRDDLHSLESGLLQAWHSAAREEVMSLIQPNFDRLVALVALSDTCRRRGSQILLYFLGDLPCMEDGEIRTAFSPNALPFQLDSAHRDILRLRSS
jgi:hypothetical protein